MSVNTVINTNTMALTSHRALTNVGNMTAKASERLSTGLRINKASDDAAGLAISEKMRGQIRGLNQAARNANDGISMIQTAEGALSETHEMLQRMRELVVQASSDALEQSDRDKIALELDELSNEIHATAEKTQYNKQQLIDGTWENTKIYLQIGANGGQGLEFNIAGMNADSLGVNIKDIGDIVRGKYNTNLSGQDAGVDSIPGKYDVDALNQLGITSSTKETYNLSFLGTGGTLDLGNGNKIAADANGNVTITGNVTFTLIDENGNEVMDNQVPPQPKTGTWTNENTNLTKDDLVGKKFVNDNNTTSVEFFADPKVDGKIIAQKTTYAQESAVVDIPNPGAAPYSVSGVDLTVFKDKKDTAVSSGSDLYDQKGQKIVDAGGKLAADTQYYDAKGVQLFSTGANVTDLTVYTAGDAVKPGITNQYELKSNSGVILNSNGSTIEINSQSDPVFGKDPTNGNLTPINGGLAKNQNYYDASGNILFSTTDNKNEIVEYSTSKLELTMPGTSAKANLSSIAAGMEATVDKDGMRITNFGGLSVAKAGVAGKLDDTTNLSAGKYVNSSTGELLFTVEDDGNGNLSIYKNDRTPPDAVTPASAIDVKTSGDKLDIGAATLTGDGTDVKLTSAAGTLKVWDSATNALKDVATGDALAANTTYYDASGDELFKTDANKKVADIYGDATVTEAAGDITEYKYSGSKFALGTPADVYTEDNTLTMGSVVLTGESGDASFGLSGGDLYDSVGKKVFADGDTAKMLSNDTTYYDDSGKALFKTDNSGKIAEIYVDGAETYDDTSSATTTYNINSSIPAKATETKTLVATVSVAGNGDVTGSKTYGSEAVNVDLGIQGSSITVGSVKLEGGENGTGISLSGGDLYDADGNSVASAGGSVSLSANTAYYDKAGNALFSTGDTANKIANVHTDAKVNEITAQAVDIDLSTQAGSLSVGGITIQGDIVDDGTGTTTDKNIITTSADLYDKDGNVVLHTSNPSSGTPSDITDDLQVNTTYYDASGNALFKTDATDAKKIVETYQSSSRDVTAAGGSAQTITLPPTVKVAEGQIKITQEDDGTFTLADSGAYLGSIATKNAQGGFDDLTSTSNLAVGDYYDKNTGLKLFSITEDDEVLDWSLNQGAKETESLYTPETSYQFSAYENGLINANENLKFSDGSSFKGGVDTLEDLDGKTIVDELNGKSWTFSRITDESSEDFGKMMVTDQDNNKTILTIDVPVKGSANTELGSFAEGLDLGGLVINSNGAMSIGAGSSITSSDGKATLEEGYDFATGTDHYGKTFELPDANVSFDENGKVSIEALNGGHRLDTSKMNDKAKAAYEDFNSKLKEFQETGESHGKIISLLTNRLDAAVEIVSTQRAQLGAYQNRLEHTIKTLEISSENLTAAESRIRDTDMAKEMMNFTKSNILQQAAISMLAQANQMPQNVLQLLR